MHIAGNVMAKSIIQHTQSGVIAQKLRQNIVNGKYFSGMKLPSTRLLADKFNVSQQAIKSALLILEEKKLILRKPRIGIFVNPENNMKCREYCLLSQIGQNTPYSATVLSVSCQDLWEGINLRSRYLSPCDLSRSSFLYELEQLKEQVPACLLLSVNLPDIADICNQLPFPSVYLGDAEKGSGTFNNNIVEDTSERAAFAVNIALSERCRNIVMIGGSSFWAHFLIQGGKRAVKGTCASFDYIEHETGNHDITIARILAQKNKVDCLIIDGFFHIDSFLERLGDKGFELGKNLKVIADGEVVKNAIYIKTDYTEFSREVLRLTSLLCDNPKVPLGRIFLKNKIKRTVIKTY